MPGYKDDKRLMIIGDNCMNIVLRVPNELVRGKNTDVRQSIYRPGGNALVTAILLARWQARVSYVGVMGYDASGQELRGWMRRAGLGTEGLVNRGRTRVSYAIVDESERTILDERPEPRQGELNVQDWESVPYIKQQVQQADIIMLDRYCSGIHANVSETIKSRKERGERSILVYRTGSRHSEKLEIESQILPSTDICLTKMSFLEGLSLSNEPVTACKQLAERFNLPLVAATAGERGAGYYDLRNKEGGLVPPRIPGPAVNTLGGGDFFRAGFLYAISQGNTVEEAVRWGNLTAGLHCSRPETEDMEALFFRWGEGKPL
jgi:ribokinase